MDDEPITAANLENDDLILEILENETGNTTKVIEYKSEEADGPGANNKILSETQILQNQITPAGDNER